MISLKQVKKQSRKANISLRRRLSLYLWRISLLFKLLLVVFALLFFFTDLFKSQKEEIRSRISHFAANYGFVLETLIIEGQVNIPPKDIVLAIGADKGEAIFSINIADVKESLEENMWVKTAIVERRLPSTIHISIQERRPIAIWQFQKKLYLIDDEGNRITKFDGVGFEDLLLVVGQDANLYADILIRELNRYPALANRVKTAIRYGQRRWNLIFEQDITVKMPENGFAKAYDYIRELNKNKRFFDQGYKMLDLRDHQKYYLEKK